MVSGVRPPNKNAAFVCLDKDACRNLVYSLLAGAGGDESSADDSAAIESSEDEEGSEADSQAGSEGQAAAMEVEGVGWENEEDGDQPETGAAAKRIKGKALSLTLQLPVPVSEMAGCCMTFTASGVLLGLIRGSSDSQHNPPEEDRLSFVQSMHH